MKLIARLLLVVGIVASVNAHAGDPAVDAAACSAHLGAVGYIQERDGKAASKINLSRFVAIDNSWGNNPAYRQAQKNIDANLAKDPANLTKNIVSLGQGCRNMGVPTAQF